MFDSFALRLYKHIKTSYQSTGLRSGSCIELSFGEIWSWQPLSHRASNPVRCKKIGRNKIKSYFAMILSPHHYEPHSKSVFQKNCVLPFSVIDNINLTKNCNCIFFFFGKYMSRTKLKQKHAFTKTPPSPSPTYCPACCSPASTLAVIGLLAH